jgi:hypothetical protein
VFVLIKITHGWLRNFTNNGIVLNKKLHMSGFTPSTLKPFG